jgi:hypothetical protein
MLAILAALTAAATPFHATLKAPTHTPKVETRWNYTVRVTDLRGRPIAARLTVQVTDPFGGLHPVEFGSTTKPIRNWPMKGVFTDYVRWPRASKGFKLTLRVTVRAQGSTKRIDYWVKAR